MSTMCGIEFIEGVFVCKACSAHQGGIGKVNASVAATLLCNHFGCGLIVLGTGGRDIVVVTELQRDHRHWLNGGFHLAESSPPVGLPKPGRGFLHLRLWSRPRAK